MYDLLYTTVVWKYDVQHIDFWKVDYVEWQCSVSSAALLLMVYEWKNEVLNSGLRLVKVWSRLPISSQIKKNLTEDI